jgi:addiction module HigA family antidote
MSCQHPGQILLHQYLQPHRLSQNRLARAIKVPPRRINEIILEKRAITADTAVRLAHYFGNSASYWMHLQAEYDIEQARERIHVQLSTIRPPVNDTSQIMDATNAKKAPPDSSARRNAGRRIMR